jgi:restriction system protein
MEKMYMVRAGEKASHYNEFRSKNIIGIGWNELGNLNQIRSLNEIRDLMEKIYPNDKKQKLSNNIGQIKKFLLDMEIDDYVLTYNSEAREYSIGKIISDYKYEENFDYKNIRDVSWENTFPRDLLTDTSKYSLGGLATVFEISDDVKKEIFEIINNKDIAPNSVPIEETENDENSDNIKENFEEQAREFIKDKISEFDWKKMQDLVAALIRSLGFKTKVSPAGPDRGKDIFASPDGLGLNDPRILVEVKHRQGSMGSQEIRSFLGAFRSGNKGIYVSTGGFTKEAKYEAERAEYPITLMDLDYLVDLIIANYDDFDIAGRSILPLKKLYWPI